MGIARPLYYSYQTEQPTGNFISYNYEGEKKNNKIRKAKLNFDFHANTLR